MYATILVPLDGSSRAERILPHVEKLAQDSGSKVIFLQVLSPDSIIDKHSTISDLNLDRLNRKLTEAESYLKSWRGEFRQKGITARQVVKHGPIVDTILEVAEENDADLIAMASHGRGGLERVFYGSVTAAVLQRIDRPLLLVRSRKAR
jgi:nucleotide-binding universal stress UspA family protein